MKIILIVTRDSIHLTEYPIFKLLNSNIKGFINMLEIEEHIDVDGNIKVELQEYAINDLLRQIFYVKPDVVMIALKNSLYNPVHEKTLENLLHTAGIKAVYVSHREDQFISFLSAMFAEPKNGAHKS